MCRNRTSNCWDLCGNIHFEFEREFENIFILSQAGKCTRVPMCIMHLNLHMVMFISPYGNAPEFMMGYTRHCWLSYFWNMGSCFIQAHGTSSAHTHVRWKKWWILDRISGLSSSRRVIGKNSFKPNPSFQWWSNSDSTFWKSMAIWERQVGLNSDVGIGF